MGLSSRSRGRAAHQPLTLAPRVKAHRGRVLTHATDQQFNNCRVAVPPAVLARGTKMIDVPYSPNGYTHHDGGVGGDGVDYELLFPRC